MKNAYNLKAAGKFLRYTRILTCFAAFIVNCPQGFSQNISKDHQDGHIYFKIRDDVFFNIPSERDEVLLDHAYFLNDLKKQHKIDKINKSFFFSDSEILKRTFRLEFSDHENADKIIAGLYKTGIVEYAEKVPLDHFSYTPNDPSMSQQWFLTQINAAKAWDLCKGDPKVTVAIVDNGVQTAHPDLKDNIWVNPNEIAGNGIDDDGNGFIDDINGWDTSDKDNNPNPGSGGAHGTHCAGDAAAVSDNGTGVAGIGYNVSIIAVKIAPNSSPNSPTTGLEGITYAASVKARVISCSWGGGSLSQTAQNVINDAYNKGCLVVTAAGNNNSESKYYPAAYDNVLSVASTASGDARSSFSNYGAWVDIAAPGSNIYSTVPGGYGNMSGTSMACPVTAGLCGLMISLNPAMTPAQVESCLKSSATNIDAKNPNYVGKLGAGRINAEAALKCVSGTLSSPPVANFVANITTSCSGTVKFTDQSTFAPSTWQWDFGDGNTSTVQNPTHTYAKAGNYTVKLTVTNKNGTDTETKTSYVTITKPADPAVTHGTRCGSGMVNLSASGTNTLRWYDAPTGGNLVHTGATYSPALNSTTTFYVASEIVSAPQKTGPADTTISKGGAYFTANNLHGLIFDVLAPSTLKTVKVFADAAGSRIIEVVSGATVLQTGTFNIPAGESRVTLNFKLDPGTGYLLKVGDASPANGLWRTNNGGTLYPYTVSGVVSINTTTAGTNPGSYYYYFFDWEVEKESCSGNRIPVTGKVDACTGISENSGGNNIIIYPNPTSGETGISFSSAEKGDFIIDIRNELGQLIYSEKLDDQKGDYFKQLDLSGYGKGIYFLTLKNSQSQHIRKLIVY